MVDVRTITEDEVPAYVEAVQNGFHRTLRETDVEYRRPWVIPGRSHAAFDDGHIIGTARSFAAELTVPGGAVLPVAGVTSVTVLATHTRRGVLTEMMRQQLDDIRNRNEPVAMLIAAEAPIYGRFGYGAATEHTQLVVDVPMVRHLLPTPPGDVRRCSAVDLSKEGPAIYERFRRAQPGSIDRPEFWWNANLANPDPSGSRKEIFHVIRRGVDGTADGYATYKIHSEFDHRVSRSWIELSELVATSDDAYVALWQHCTSVDWVRRIDAGDRPVTEPLPWMLYDQRAARQQHRADFLWLCLTDPAVALAARRYRVADRIVVGVRDGETFVVDGGPDGASCVATNDTPDLVINATELGAAYLGGSPLWAAAAAGLVDERRAGAVAAFDRMFGSDVVPWCNTWF